MKKNLVDIPREKMFKGVSLCKENIQIFLDTAETLINSENLDQGAINIEFAIEEFGKVLKLKDEFVKGSNPIQVPCEVFRSHKGKSERAWKKGDIDTLDVSYRMISEGGFGINDDGKQGFSRAFSQVVNISHHIRLCCAFVDFDKNENEWFLGYPQLSKNRMKDLIKHIRQKINTVTFN